MNFHFRTYQPLDRNNAASELQCPLCQRKTDREMEFVYYVSSIRFCRWVPMHQPCYQRAVRRIRMTAWMAFGLTFCILSGVLAFVIWRGPILLIPIWIIFISTLFAATVAFFVNMHQALILEYRIRDCIDERSRLEEYGSEG